MARIIIQGVEPWDGMYELDRDRQFNMREWRWVREISGYLPINIEDGFAKADPTLWMALAVIALCRAGKIDRDEALDVAEKLAERPWDYDEIKLVSDKSGDANPPALTSEPDAQSRRSSLESKGSSGETSRSDSAPLVPIP